MSSGMCRRGKWKMNNGGQKKGEVEPKGSDRIQSQPSPSVVDHQGLYEDSRQIWGTTATTSLSSCPASSQTGITRWHFQYNNQHNTSQLYNHVWLFYINLLNFVVHNTSLCSIWNILRVKLAHLERSKRKKKKEVIFLRNAQWYYKVVTKPTFCKPLTSLKFTQKNLYTKFKN